MGNVWAVLLKRAEADVTLRQQELAECLGQVSALERNRAHLEALLERYLDQLARAQCNPHLVGDVTVYHRFIGQIQVLQARVTEDVALSERTLGQVQEAYRRADAECLKTKTLLNQERERVRRMADVREQRRMDAQALMRFSFRRTELKAAANARGAGQQNSKSLGELSQ